MARKDTFEKKLQRERFSNAQGQIIPMHHAFQKIDFTLTSKLMVFIGAPLIAFLMWWGFPYIADFWGHALAFWMGKLGFTPGIAAVNVELMLQEFTLYYPALDSWLPTSTMVWINLFAMVILFALSLFFPGQTLPLIYVLRAAILIQASASVFFLISPDWFPYHLPSYSVNCLLLSLCLLVVAPLLLGMIYYIFDFPLIDKLLLTAMMLMYFIIALPLQYLVHAWVIYHISYLFMPVMYFMLAVLPDVLMFICFYSIGMSWRPERTDPLGRYA